MQLPVQALSVRVVDAVGARGGTVDDMVRVAQACDDAGFLYVAVCHHVAIPREPAEMMSTQWFDPVATLGYLAAHTTRTRLMTNVFVAAYQPPARRPPRRSRPLDALSNGRLIVGVGAGHVEGEFDALGVPFAERGAITDEAIDAILAALDRRVDAARRTALEYAEVGQRPRPVQQPHPPIWIGGSGKPALRRVAHVGDGWIPQAHAARPARPTTSRTSCASATRCGRARCPRSAITASCTSASRRGTCPKCAMTGRPTASSTRDQRLGAIGVSHLQVRCSRRDRRRAVRPDRARSAPRSARTSPRRDCSS